MAHPDDATPAGPATFSEKGFYLDEFRGKTLAIAVPAADLREPTSLVAVVDELCANGARVVVLSTERPALERLVGHHVVSMATPRLEATVWRQLRESLRIGLMVGGSIAFARACREAAMRLGIQKLVWIDRDGGIVRPDGERTSFVHLAELQEILASPHRRSGRRDSVLREIEAMLLAGVPAVNVCSLAGLHDELFTYAGSGTLFTRERYVVVRKLGIDDFDAASDLIARGTAEGYLAPRDAEQHDAVLASGFGAFIEGYHLAGIGALLIDRAARCAEIASLYTLTRFIGEGVGGHLVTHARTRAEALDLDYVYACTTSERVAAFFARNGFCAVSPATLPPAKWRGYSQERRALLTCLRADLVPSQSAAEGEPA
jgi:N-acetylglutamate synthase-like GNAT family acetyltransferase